jgi:hypothetical protein
VRVAGEVERGDLEEEDAGNQQPVEVEEVVKQEDAGDQQQVEVEVVVKQVAVELPEG